ncbi:uncharacterized protein LOC132729947 [Ruditapes philippinarum]|uniref:uncharacterized protein LOC132729947 n=1 Tax=Ruditapes philippinarum TaxID=129788 RepID=UPI00295AB138|nr:uncharacterized protein LOC132729947 [Ruditapes philippinarum]
MTETEKMHMKLKDRVRKRLIRSRKSPTEKENDLETDKLRKEKERCQMTCSDKESILHKDKVRKNSQRSQMTSSEKKTALNKDKVRKDRQRSQMTSTQKETALNKDKVRKDRHRSQMTSTQKETALNKDKVRKERQRSQMTSSQKETALNKDKVRKDRHRSQMTSTQKETAFNKDKVRKDRQKSQMTSTQKETALNKDKVRKERQRSQMTSTQKETALNKDKVRKERQRSQMTSTQKDLLNTVDRCRKQSKRQSTALEEKVLIRERESGLRQSKRTKTQSLHQAIEEFHLASSQGPVYVCASCLRMLYKQSVIKYKQTKYMQSVSKVISTDYPCFENIWVCNTCHKHLLKGRVPPQNFSNDLQVDRLPEELIGLTSLEGHLISQRIPFMKIMSRPRGGQKAISGAVVNVPVDCSDTCKSLPRPPPNSSFIMLKLKRKKEYRSTVIDQVIRPAAVNRALKCLIKINPLYQDVEENEEAFLIESDDEDKEMWTDILCNQTADNTVNVGERKNETENVHSDLFPDENERASNQTEHNNDASVTESLNQAEDNDIVSYENNTLLLTTNSDETNDCSYAQEHDNDVSDDEDLHELDIQKGIPLDTCLQPTECQGNDIISIAPAEGNRPLSLLNDPHAELLAFPVLFPYGRFGYNTNRCTRLHFRKYLNTRLLNIDTRFATNIDYIFFMQFLAEKKQIVENVYIALRKTQCSESVTAATLRSSDILKTFIAKDLAYTILKNIRGSPAYWQKCMYDLLGMVRQLGQFTWFLTLSSADLRWTDTIRIIAQQSGVLLTDKDIDNMPWEERCRWIRNNPVTTARHFDYKVQQFFKLIIQKNKALGNVTDFFIRTEFQQRGSPHVHCVLWVKDAPMAGEQSEEEVCSFVDQYIHCTLPHNDDQLLNLVSTLQKHSHTRSCRKGLQFCRYHFPKPPVPYTLLVTEEDKVTSKPNPPTNAPSNQTAQHDEPDDDPQVNYKNIFIQVQQYIQQFEKNYPDEKLSLSQVLNACNVSEELYIKCLRKLETGAKKVLHKREPCDKCINNYNPTVLKAWQANMDLQFVTDVYTCIMYIVSYITKDERELSDVLRQASKQACDQNIKQQLRQLGNVFLNHREISAQEAIYRALPLPLRRTSRTVIFVTTDLPEDRVKLVKPSNILEQLDDESEEVFSTSVIDRYVARPDSFSQMTLAEFASWFTVTSNSTKEDFLPDIMENEEELQGTVIKLKNGKGRMRKRKTQAIVRTHVFSKMKQSEKFYHSKLMLYFPWRDENELKLHFSTFQDAYQNLEEQVKENMKQFEYNSEAVDTALEDLEENGPMIDVWDTLNSEALQRNADDLIAPRIVDTDSAMINPDFFTGINSHDIRGDIGTSAATYSLKDNLLTDEENRTHIQHLNKEQREIFDEILRWCREYSYSKKWGSPPPPFHLFVTGGAGTGKSYLIRAIYNTAVRELQGEGDCSSDCTVLLTAPTGTAAFNIDGMTIHSALKLPIKQHSKAGGEYTPLSQEKLHDLRCKLSYLTILIIDEISMVSAQDLYHIHRRLCDIKGTSDPGTYFGGVSILAFVDLYQLPPMGAKPVFSLPENALARLDGSLWENLFTIHHLETIMRQKDDVEFANMLNRIRVESHTENDIKVLESRIVHPGDPDYPQDALHVFPSNEEVDSHNARKLLSLNMPLVTFTAVDIKSDNTPLPETLNLPKNQSLTGGLCEKLSLCKGARVMITKNIDVTEGLVNGTQGIVEDFWSAPTGEVTAIIVKCDQQKCGQQSRLKFPHIARKYPGGTPIFRDEVHIQTKTCTVIRQQFPLRLCWACTMHKTQGMTLPKCVVSIAGRFNDGQCYVALSRVTSLSDLFITKFDKKKIRASKDSTDALHKMNKKKFKISRNPVITKPSNFFSIVLQNVRSVVKHIQDIRTSHDFSLVDLLCFTETWLKRHKTPEIQGMRPFRQDRSHKRAGGVLAYVNTNFESTCLKASTSIHADLLLVKIDIFQQTLYLVLVYCAPDGNKNAIISCIDDILTHIPPDQHLIILGDFNHVTLQIKSLHNIVDSPTCKTGSILDQAYTNWKTKPLVYLSPAYFSDHDTVWIGLPLSDLL